MKKTHDQLIKELAEFDQSNQSYAAREKRLREEFSRVLGAPKKRQQYGYSDDYTTYSWEEIFAEIGKLLAARTFMDLEGNVSGLEVAVASLRQQFDNPKQ